MKHVKKSVLLSYSAHEMYELVTAVADYPKFLPWCERAEVLKVDDAGMTARLHLAFAGVRQAFTTRNEHTPDSAVMIRLVDGPFSKLDGDWRFHPLGSDDDACRIDFTMSYQFSNRAFEAVLSPAFDRVANTFVDAFVKRAEQVHGAR